MVTKNYTLTAEQEAEVEKVLAEGREKYMHPLPTLFVRV